MEYPNSSGRGRRSDWTRGGAVGAAALAKGFELEGDERFPGAVEDEVVAGEELEALEVTSLCSAHHSNIDSFHGPIQPLLAAIQRSRT